MISVILGTYNRSALLKPFVESVRKSMVHAALQRYEIVVADGGSSDGSHEWLRQQPDVIVVDGGREGAVKAFNAAFEAANGDYIVSLNDDCLLGETAIRRAKELLDSDEKIGQVAFGFTRRDNGNRVFIEHITTDRPYANFGMIRTALAMAAADICGGYWNPRYRTYGGDTELSCWVWRLGYRVEPIRAPLIHDILHDDILRQDNYRDGRATADGALFWQRWGNDKSSPLPKITPRGEYPNITPEEIAKLKLYEENETL